MDYKHHLLPGGVAEGPNCGAFAVKTYHLDNNGQAMETRIGMYPHNTWPYPSEMLQENDYNEYVPIALPAMIVLDISHLIRRLQSVFQDDVDYVLHRVIEAISDRKIYNIVISKLVQDLYTSLLAAGHYQPQDLFDQMITLEQVALDIQDYVEKTRLYLNHRFLPYQYETLLPDGSVVIKRIDSFQEFCDTVGLAEISGHYLDRR